MADNTINVKIREAYDTEANWSQKNPKLLQGQIAISSDKHGMYKVGDGTKTWSQLSYASHPASDVYAWAKAQTKPSYSANEISGAVTGVKGASEANYRTGNVNLTPGNIGALDKSGDTMTGTLGIKGEQYYWSNGACGINMNNSDIINLNSIYMADSSEDAREGINFYRSSNTYDSVHANNGVLYFTPNRAKNSAGTSYPILYHENGYLEQAMYLNIHPENNPIIIPFIHNDIAYLLERGGSATVLYDGVAQGVNISGVFDGSGSYGLIMNPTGVNEIVVELTLHRQFGWTSTVYVDFGAQNWRAKNIKLEVMNQSVQGDTWVQKGSVTNWQRGHYFVRLSHTPQGAANAGSGFNKIRFTFSGWGTATIFRIATIGVYNYNSQGLRETFLPKNGGQMFGSITPFSNNKYDIGSANNHWNNGYFTNINGSAVGNSPKFTDTVDLASMTGTLSVGHGGTGATSFTSGELLIGNGTNAVVTRAIKNITTKGNLGWTSSATDIYIPTVNTLAYWDGRYDSTRSNLTYCSKGAFGNLAIKDSLSKADVGLGNVENKSSATIRGELTKENVTTALGYTPPTTNTTYPYYIKIIDADFKDNFRLQTKGDTEIGGYIANIRNNTASVANSPQHGSGLAFGESDTHGYLYTSYSSDAAYIGGGNAGKLNWISRIYTTNYKPTKSDVGLGNVDNKSSATIRSEITKDNVTTALGYTPVNKAGDIVTGVLNLQKGQLVHFANASGGTDGYLKICRMTIVHGYVNAPIEIAFTRRGDSAVTRIYVLFKNTSGTDPDIDKFGYIGVVSQAYIHKASASTWDIYIKKNQSWEHLDIVDYHMPTNDDGITLTWLNEFSSTLPDGQTQATTVGNVAYATSSGTASSATNASTATLLKTSNANTTTSTSNWRGSITDGVVVWGQRFINSVDLLKDDGTGITDSGDISLWLRKAGSTGATLNLSIDGDVYANGSDRLSKISETVTLGTAQTITGAKTFSNDILFQNSGTTTRQIKGTIGDNDVWRIAGGATASNAGWVEIASGDDGNEPVYARQYTGSFTTIKRTATLLDGSGNTSFPGQMTTGSTIRAVGGHVYAGDSTQTEERRVGVSSVAGDMYLYSNGMTDGQRGLWLPAHGTATSGKNIIHIDTNNNATFSGQLNGNALSATVSSFLNPTNSNTTYGSSTERGTITDGLVVFGESFRNTVDFVNEDESIISDSGDITMWMKQEADNDVRLNMSIDGDYYAHKDQPIAKLSEVVTITGEQTIAGLKRFDGGLKAQHGVFYGTYSERAEMYHNSSIELRENDLVGNEQDAFEYGPKIGFHWGDIGAGTFGLHSNGLFYLRQSNGVDRATLDANIQGHASDDVNKSGDTMTGSLIVNNGKIWSGTDELSSESNLWVNSNSGSMCLYSTGNANQNGNRGLYIGAHGTGDAKNLILVDTNNNATFYGSLTGHASEDVPITTGFGQNLSGYASYNDNTISGTVVRYSSGQATEKPTGADHALFQMAYSDSWKTQLAQDWRTNKAYIRSCTNGTWGNWAEVYTTASKPSASDIGAVAKTGDTMSGNLVVASTGIYAGTWDDKAQREIYVRSKSGGISLYAIGNEAGNGGRGIWVNAHGTGNGLSVISVDTNNQPTYNGFLSVTSYAPTTAAAWNVPFRSRYSGNELSINNSFIYHFKSGSSSSSTGYAILQLGNNTADSAQGGTRGRVRIFGNSTGYSDLYTNVTTSSKAIYLPARGGTIFTTEMFSLSGTTLTISTS